MALDRTQNITTRTRTRTTSRVTTPQGATVTTTQTRPQLTVPTSSRRAPTQEEIARRAYQIWLSRGGGDGNDLADWLQAEKELRG